MKLYLALLLSRWLFREFEPPKFSESKKIAVYHEVYEVEKFKELLESQLSGFIKQVALRSRNNDEIQFYRGAIFTLQLLLQNMRKYHERYLKDKKSLYAVQK